MLSAPAVGLNTTKKKHTITDIDSAALALNVLAIISDPESDFHRLMINSLGTLFTGVGCVVGGKVAFLFFEFW
jgi:hypothetical protein